MFEKIKKLTKKFTSREKKLLIILAIIILEHQIYINLFQPKIIATKQIQNENKIKLQQIKQIKKEKEKIKLIKNKSEPSKSRIIKTKNKDFNKKIEKSNYIEKDKNIYEKQEFKISDLEKQEFKNYNFTEMELKRNANDTYRMKIKFDLKENPRDKEKINIEKYYKDNLKKEEKVESEKNLEESNKNYDRISKKMEKDTNEIMIPKKEKVQLIKKPEIIEFSNEFQLEYMDNFYIDKEENKENGEIEIFVFKSSSPGEIYLTLKDDFKEDSITGIEFEIYNTFELDEIGIYDNDKKLYDNELKKFEWQKIEFKDIKKFEKIYIKTEKTGRIIFRNIVISS